MALMDAKGAVFARYDTSADGYLSNEEMMQRGCFATSWRPTGTMTGGWNAKRRTTCASS